MSEIQVQKAIIHVGLHKTASTYLQEAVLRHIKGFNYLGRPYTQHNHVFNQLQYASDNFFDQRRFQEELAHFAGKKLIISDENLSGKPVFLSYVNQGIIAKRLQKALPQAEILVFIRGQKGAMRSTYNQWVKGANAGYKPIEDFYWQPHEDYSYDDFKAAKKAPKASLYYNTNQYYLHMDCFRYSKVIELYKQYFPHVHVLLYEDLETRPEWVFERLEQIFEVPIDRSPVEIATTKNQSLDEQGLYKKRLLNRIRVLSANNWYERIVYSLWYLFAHKTHFETDEDSFLEKAITYFKEDNQYLIKNYPEIGLQRFPNQYRT